MNHDRAASENLGELAPLPALLLAYAPAQAREWQRLCWLLDQRLAQVVRRGGEPTIAAIRLAWWDAVLVEGDRAKGGGEPLVEAWRVVAPAGSAIFAEQLIDGWRMLLGTEPPEAAELAGHGRKRGGGLFGLIAGAGLDCAGAVWALWDLAGQGGDPSRVAEAMAQAKLVAAEPVLLPSGRAAKPLRLLHDLARADISAGRVPVGGFAARHYRRLLWRGLIG